jgi:hypothetical protein
MTVHPQNHARHYFGYNALRYSDYRHMPLRRKHLSLPQEELLTAAGLRKRK